MKINSDEYLVEIKMKKKLYSQLLLVALNLVIPPVMAEISFPKILPQQTEVYEPVPLVVTPGPELPLIAPPSDATVLFDGSNLDAWVNSEDGSPASWLIADGVMTVNKATGNIRTRRQFGNFQIHLEWKIPEDIAEKGQARGNSGLFLASQDGQSGYEIQILDSYKNETYVNGMAGSIYKQSIPLANATRQPGEWQTYDIIWTAPVFNDDGGLHSPARITALHNGILIQNNFELQGETVFIGTPEYHAHGKSWIMLQAHQDPSPPISFRNIWLRELP